MLKESVSGRTATDMEKIHTLCHATISTLLYGYQIQGGIGREDMLNIAASMLECVELIDRHVN